ncbi:hypothetical protein ACET3X_004762 [Alternaria dauci]|uniref:C2H2-type domain-containing protein n=1 Tax=Alternaria dauci TaxID=48095 RepID=A0ABR3UIB4_9PLEO
MPKGKPKKDNPALYEGSPEPPEPSMARQAAAHRRGGTHKVRDENKTNSEYDNYNYKELVDQAKERGIYRKDMKKAEMALALKHNDEERKRAERDAVQALERKRQEAKEEEERIAAERQRQIEEKHKRRIEKEKRRERDESVSDDTVSDADFEAQENSRNEYTHEEFGQVLSDESWNSTSTESSPESVDRDIKPDCRLRLLEWPYEKLPDANPPQFFSFFEPKPRTVPYAPLKLITTYTREKIVLPGSKYPAGIDPDFCPILSPTARSAARNGHLTGPLRKAIIEAGTDWAERTLVQGWNAHMYFQLGSRNESKVLADTYQKWHLENRKLLRVKGRAQAMREERAARHAQRKRNKRRLAQDVYETSAWRPGAMGEGEWGDPRSPNPAWDEEEVDGEEEEEEYEEEATKIQEEVKVGESTDQPGSKSRIKSPNPTKTRLTRIRRPSVLTSSPPLSPSSPVTFARAVAQAEHHLSTRGLSSTLSIYRSKWLANGKSTQWRTFAVNLPKLWPSGNIPVAPPAESRPGVSLALKIAAIDMLDVDEKTIRSPLMGGERWTEDDDGVWGVVEVEEGGSEGSEGSVGGDEDGKDGGEDEVHENGEDEGSGEADEGRKYGALEEIGYESDDEALYRRSSIVIPEGKTAADPVVAWLDMISPRLAPSITPMNVPKASRVLDVEMGLDEWEEKYLQDCEAEESEACPFCCKLWGHLMAEERARHMLSHDTARPVERRHKSPRVGTLSRHPNVHSEQRPNPRKRSIGDDSGLEFPSTCSTKLAKQRKAVIPYIKIVKPQTFAHIK